AFATCTGLYNSKSASLNISGLVGPPVSFTRQKADACTGEKDKAIWTSGGESRLNSASYKCGNQCAGENSCSAACISQSEGYSTDCSSCMGSLISCATSECLGTCKGEEACQACIDKTCGAAFATCTGLYNSKSASLNISGLVGPPVSFTRQKADACTGEKDKAIWTSGGESRLNSASYKCGNQCAGENSCSSLTCSAACISQSEGYSTDCSSCMGSGPDFVRYFRVPGDLQRNAIVNKQWKEAFATCTGLYNSKSASLNISGLVGPPVSFTRQKADACTGEKDKAIWTSGGESRLNSASYKCGNQCAGENSCSAACISQSEGYSTDCSSCMGSLISCATSECLGTCKGEEACQACIDKTCGAAFATCTGLYNSKSASLNISGLVGPPVSFTRQKADACTGEKDKAIWTSGGESRLNSASYKCGNQCAGENSCSSLT
ncbi:unnamed protein product, partial [Polarella glacialis]